MTNSATGSAAQPRSDPRNDLNLYVHSTKMNIRLNHLFFHLWVQVLQHYSGLFALLHRNKCEQMDDL